MLFCKNPKILVREKNGKLYEINQRDKILLELDEVIYNQQAGIGKYELLHYEDKNLVVVPCGVCEACRASQRDEWALRCLLESRDYDSNIFVTLTYNKKHCPRDGVSKEDFQRFIHTLREYFRRDFGHIGIRYFGCGEYGDKSHRPHYHIILFNCPHFEDEKLYKENQWNQKIYRSKILERLWRKGMCVIGSVNSHSISYVAKCRLRRGKEIHIKFNDEFRLMSRRKGIGYSYLMENFEQIVHDGKIVVSGNAKKSLPMYYNRLIKDKIGIERYNAELKNPRIERAKKYILNKHDGASEQSTQSKLSDEKLKLEIDYDRDIVNAKNGEDDEQGK